VLELWDKLDVFIGGNGYIGAEWGDVTRMVFRWNVCCPTGDVCSGVCIVIRLRAGRSGSPGLYMAANCLQVVHIYI